jgi:hypothetical protein
VALAQRGSYHLKGACFRQHTRVPKFIAEVFIFRVFSGQYNALAPSVRLTSYTADLHYANIFHPTEYAMG